MTVQVPRRQPTLFTKGCISVVLGCVLVVLAVWLWWRGSFVYGHDVDARVTFAASGLQELRKLRLIAGADKAYWPELRAGDSVRTTLFTEGEDTSLIIQFVIQGREVSWHGPTFPAGTGYRIAIQVDSSGQVSEQHCVLPCQLL